MTPKPRLHAGGSNSREVLPRLDQPDDLAEGMTEIVRNLDYANFKNEVARRDSERAHTYSQVWGVLGGLQPGGADASE